jgi:hypothetical protein
MTTYRVEIDGVTVLDKKTKTYVGLEPFGDYLRRPAEPAVGETPPPPAHLFIDDELVGVQRSLTDEALELDAAADACLDPVESAQIRAYAAQARASAAAALALQTKEG